MIAFGCAIGEPEPYVSYAAPGIERAAEPDSVILPYAAVGTIGRSYNLLLDAAAKLDDLEALVLVHPHLEITDPELCAKIRRALADPGVAVLGCSGARGVESIAWWDAEVVSGPVIHRYTEHGGGELPALAWRSVLPPPQEVETVDGFLMVLSPWAVRELRFDEGLTYGHGFDLDFCRQVRRAGRTVLVCDLRVIQHRSLELVEDVELWVEGHIQLERKWDSGRPEPDAGGDGWKERARRAEAEREAARAMAYSRRLAIDARIEALQRELNRTTATASWRLTRPLREVNQWRRRRAARRAAVSR